jgi:hypothetical protein
LTPTASTSSSPIEQTKLDAIVARLNELSQRAALDLAYAVGELIIRELYGGSLAAWREQGTRRASYRRLVARTDLLLTPIALCRAIGVYTLCERHGGKTSWASLSISHLHEVLALEPSEQDRLLGIAKADHWTVARLRAEIRDGRRKKRLRGRSIRKTVRAVQAFVREGKEVVYDPKKLGRLDTQTLDELNRTIAVLQHELELMRRALRGM